MSDSIGTLLGTLANSDMEPKERGDAAGILARKIQDITAENERLRSAMEWVSVEDRLPEIRQTALCLGQEQYTETVGDEDVISFRAVYDLGDIEKEGRTLTMFAFCSDAYVTHWMPIPPAPQEPDLFKDMGMDTPIFPSVKGDE